MRNIKFDEFTQKLIKQSEYVINKDNYIGSLLWVIKSNRWIPWECIWKGIGTSLTAN